MSFRRWTCTFWDEAPPEFDDSWMQYLICGQETAPSTGKKHWQSYLETKSRIRRDSVIEKLGLETHPFVTPARGSVEQNFDYTSKDGEWLEWGEPMQQGRRCDLEEMCESIREGESSVLDILRADPHSYHLYARTLYATEADVRHPPRTRPPNVRWYWGCSGAGKSYTARTEAGTDYFDHEFERNGWFDKYRGQQRVLFDEIDTANVPYRKLLRLLDIYPASVERRGLPPAVWEPTDIWITSAHHPATYYRNEGDCRELLRRITTVKHFETVFEK